MADAFYSAWAEVLPDFSKFSKTADKEFNKALVPAGDVGGKAAGKGISGGVLGAVGKLAVPLAAAFAALNVGQLIGDSITQASDLQEVGTAIGQVFGDQAGAISEFAKSGAAAFGENEIAVLRSAQSFGVYGKAAGLAGGDLTGFTTDLVGLSTDLASFFNTDTATAANALAAGLRGESEPLRQFGVLLDDATLKARAMSMGIFDGTGSLTQQQRVLAAQAEILAQTSDAQGDFARTSDGLANQQKILSAGWSDLVTQLGTLFLPIATTVVGFLNSTVIPAVSGFIDALTAGDGGGFLAFIQPIIDAVGSFLIPIFEGLAPTVAALLPQIIALWSTFSPLGLIIQLLQPLLPLVQQLATVFANALGQALALIVPVLTELAQLIGPVLTTIFAALTPILTMVVQAIGQILPVIMPLIGAVLGLIAPLVELIGAILPPLIDLFMAVLGPVLELATAVIGVLVPIIEALLGILTGLIEFVVGVFTGDWDRAWAGIQQIFSSFVDVIRSVIDGTLKLLFEGIPKFIGDIFSGAGEWLFDAGKAIIQGFIDGITGMVGAVGDAVGGVMDFIGGFFPNSPAKRGPFSGAGWAAVSKSGAAVYDEFVSGLGGDDPSLPGLGGGPGAPRPFLPRVAPLDDLVATAGAEGGPRRLKLVVGDREMDAYIVDELDRHRGRILDNVRRENGARR